MLRFLPRLARANRHFKHSVGRPFPFLGPIIGHPMRFMATSGNVNALLANLEESANANLASPILQANFYRALLESNYPQIVVSRFETPDIAKNGECIKYYIESLEKTGKMAKAASARELLAKEGSYESLPATSFSGSKLSPIHVVVNESYFFMAMRFLRYFLPFGLAVYLAMEGIALLSETGSVIRASSEMEDKLVDATKSTVKFDDVKGVDEARAELEEIADFLKDPSKFTGLGGKLPKGVLLTGPPGTGKTLLARATAGEAGVPFFFMSGSEFDEVYVGVGAKRVRDLFAQAREKAPAIVFIDELDAVGGKRHSRDQAYSKQTLNQLLVELDGFSQTEGIIILGATNFPESLDSALTRPGRFDKSVDVSLPDVRGRDDILKLYMNKVEVSPKVDTTILARGTPGFSGAELMNLVNLAAVYASQQNALSVDMSHLEWAKDKIVMGAAKKSMVVTESSRRMTAYHEAGHAIMALFTPGATPLYKATILPRGRSLGSTHQLPEMDKVDTTRKECLAVLDVCMGGKIAEEFIYGPENTTSGCSSDLSQATRVARAMVIEYGMSPVVGPVRLADKWNSWSPQIRQTADLETVQLLKQSEERTRKVLREKSVELERLANGLLEYETLSKEEMEKVCKGEALDKLKTITNTVVKGPENDDRARINEGKNPFPAKAEA